VTHHLTFYHGAGAAAARAIFASGSRDRLFDEIGACALGREIRKALLDHAGLSPEQDWQLPFVFDGSGLWSMALRHLDDKIHRCSNTGIFT
jgi:hypothetical protein